MRAEEVKTEQPAKGLTNRHVQLIAIGGTIGTGLFMGAGDSIHFAGPAILLIYALIGLLMFVVMRGMGEMLYADPHQHTFIAFMSKYLGKKTGVFASWSYWLTVAFMGMAELTAIGKYVQFWFPDWPSWLIQVVILVILTSVNLIAVALYGEAEFWFAMIKIVAILSLIATGIIMLLTGFHTSQGTVSLNNLFGHFSLLPNGLGNFINGFQMVMFSFVGMEFIGMTAAETPNARKILPKAINQIPLRIIFFYLGALATIMTIYPWEHIPANQSPFVAVFKLAGVNWAAALINFVVLTSAASALNSVIFSASRNFYSIAAESSNKTLHKFAKMSKHELPSWAVLATAALLLCSPLISVIPQIKDSFTFVTSASADLFIMIYVLTLVTYWQYRKSNDYLADGFLMRWPKFFVPLALIGFVFIYLTLFFNNDAFIPAVGATIWLVVFGGALALKKN
ncbi:amino acid permease [Leuconostocaceae bacterium ESL0958]|nr:amino acid permease [Leuconostocaceae bacterium ESL0958]